MTSLLADDVKKWETRSAKPDARLHLHGKTEARKVSHVNKVKPL